MKLRFSENVFVPIAAVSQINADLICSMKISIFAHAYKIESETIPSSVLIPCLTFMELQDQWQQSLQ